MNSIIFLIVFFIGFSLPNGNTFYLYFPGVTLSLNEIAYILLPLINFFSTKTHSEFNGKKHLNKVIILFFISIFISEYIKLIIFQHNIDDVIKSIRVGLPLFSTLLIFYKGFCVKIKYMWNALMLVIFVSVVISFISLFVSMPFLQLGNPVDRLIENGGRIGNSNAPFGIVSIYILFKGYKNVYMQSNLTYLGLVASSISLVASFNRTYLILSFLMGVFIFLRSGKLILKIRQIVLIVFVIIFIVLLYNSNEYVKKQVDTRILSVIKQDDSVYNQAIADNRDIMYESIFDQVKEGYWKNGMSITTPIFIWENYGRYLPMDITDITLVNLLLRYGFFPTLLFLYLLYSMNKINKDPLFSTALLLYFLASFNMCSLMRHNSILFLGMVFYLTIITVDLKHHQN